VIRLCYYVRTQCAVIPLSVMCSPWWWFTQVRVSALALFIRARFLHRETPAAMGAQLTRHAGLT